MRIACLIGKHGWQPLQGTSEPLIDTQQCSGCGRTRVWNERDGAWMHGPADGLPEDLVDLLVTRGGSGEAMIPADTEIPISRELAFSSGGGIFVPAGVIVAAVGLPLWLATPDPGPMPTIGLIIMGLGYALAAGRREIRVDRNSRALVHRIRLLPFTVFRRDHPAAQLNSIQVSWQPNARALGPRRGPKPRFLVRALGHGVSLMIINCQEPKSARSAGRSISRALDLALEDKTREPGAPGT